MQRRFNYTDRARLLRDDVKFSLKPAGEGWSFDATLDLADYELPGESLVFVEAYRQTAWMRFSFGTVGALQAPSARNLTGFDSPDDILFRVRITSPGTPEEPHGLLLAEADRVRVRGPEEVEEDSDPLLPVVPSDLGEELWRVDFDDQRPRLLINRNAGGDYKQIGLHPAFVAVVYPAAMREILLHILLVLGHRDCDDSDDPHSRWLKFAVQVLGLNEPPPHQEDVDDSSEIYDWVETATKAFARKHGLLNKFKEFWTKEFPL